MRILVVLTFLALAAPALAQAPAAAAAPASTALVGPHVGSVDLLVSQGLKEYNAKNYAGARDDFLKALRANPNNPPVYLSLARAYLQTHDVALSCYTYKVYLKAAPTAPDHEKAQNEHEQCERQRQGLHPVPVDPGVAFVDQRAAFQQAVADGKLLGPDSASETLIKMLAAGYAAPDLADLAAKLATAAAAQADASYAKALQREHQSPAELRSTAALYRLAVSVGSANATYEPRAQLVMGLADLEEHKYGEAEADFQKAIGSGNDSDARFYRVVAIYRSGDRKRALKLLQTELPDDPRTPLIKADATLAGNAHQGAQELEQLLFKERFKNP